MKIATGRWFILLSMAAMLTGCAPGPDQVASITPPSDVAEDQPATLPAPTKTDSLPAADPGSPVSEAQQAAIQALLGQTDLAASDVVVTSSEPVDWPDACLGIQAPGMMCAQMITPGYRVILESGGRTYEYHTNQSGSLAQPATLGLEWSREGGFAGYNDTLQVYLPEDGRALWSSKSSGGQVDRISEVLTQAEMDQWNQWLSKYGKVLIELKDPAVTDAMTTRLSFQGFGNSEPGKAEQEAMLAWAQNLYTKIVKN